MNLNLKPGTPLYEAHPTRKGWLVQNLNGVRTSGTMENGLFVTPECDVCGCDGFCEGEWDLCDVCGCVGNCHPNSERVFPPSLRGPSPSDFSSMEIDPEDIPYDSKRHLRVIRHNVPSGTFPTEEDLNCKQDVSEVPTTDKKQPKKKSKTKK